MDTERCAPGVKIPRQAALAIGTLLYHVRGGSIAKIVKVEFNRTHEEAVYTLEHLRQPNKGLTARYFESELGDTWTEQPLAQHGARR